MNHWYDDNRTRVNISKEDYQKEARFRQKFQSHFYLAILVFVFLGALLIRYA